jgi:hypothetical protein
VVARVAVANSIVTAVDSRRIVASIEFESFYSSQKVRR